MQVFDIMKCAKRVSCLVTVKWEKQQWQKNVCKQNKKFQVKNSYEFTHKTSRQIGSMEKNLGGIK